MIDRYWIIVQAPTGLVLSLVLSSDQASPVRNNEVLSVVLSVKRHVCTKLRRPGLDLENDRTRQDYVFDLVRSPVGTKSDTQRSPATLTRQVLSAIMKSCRSPVLNDLAGPNRTRGP